MMISRKRQDDLPEAVRYHADPQEPYIDKPSASGL